MALLPADIPTGLVVANYYFVSEDNIDVDTDPDLIPVTGNVTFTCSAKILRMPGKFATLVPLVFKAKFDAQGRLIATNDPTPGLKLPATDTTDISPRNYTWHVDFDLVQVSNGHTVKIPSFDISVPVGTTVDLTSVMPVDATPGTITIAGPQGIQGIPGPVTSMNDTDVAGLVNNTASTTRGALNSVFITGNPTLVVTYNGDGSVASTTENGVLTTFTYNTDGTVNTQTRAGVTKTFTYDANGNVTGAA